MPTYWHVSSPKSHASEAILKPNVQLSDILLGTRPRKVSFPNFFFWFDYPRNLTCILQIVDIPCYGSKKPWNHWKMTIMMKILDFFRINRYFWNFKFFFSKWQVYMKKWDWPRNWHFMKKSQFWLNGVGVLLFQYDSIFCFLQTLLTKLKFCTFKNNVWKLLKHDF